MGKGGAGKGGMDKSRKVIKPKNDTEVKDEAEIRVTALGNVSAYVSRAAKFYNELNKDEVIITGTGDAISKAVQLAEVVKRRFKGLHQITKLGTQEIVDEYELLEEGLDKVIDPHNVSFVEIKLSKKELDTSSKGYQPPIDESEVKEYPEEKAELANRAKTLLKHIAAWRSRQPT
jgi:DNA-binding protein Alba